MKHLASHTNVIGKFILESLANEIISNTGKNVVISCVYRTHGTDS